MTLFSGTHNIAMKPGILHQNNLVRLVCPSDMLVIWHERTYHGGAKSRLAKDHTAGRRGFQLSRELADKSPSRSREPKRPYQHLEDLRLFAFVWSEKGKRYRLRKDSKTPPGEELHYIDNTVYRRMVRGICGKM